MHIKHLKLNNFRNYASLNIDFSKNFNIIFGNNAQGKTNILEAIYMCSSGRSHRVSKDNELVKIGENGFFVKLSMQREESESIIEIGYERDQKKKIKINEIPVHKIGNLMGNLNTVLFSPEDLGIIKDGPSERRRFIDITISQLKPSYFYDLQQYAKTLAQRNSLLKEIQKNKSLLDTIDIWNKNLAVLGSRIIKTRNEFVERLASYAEKNHAKLTNGMEKLIFRYAPSVKMNGYSDVKEIEKEFLHLLESSIGREILLSTTLYGPQRDDYIFFLNDMNIKNFGSQGQQRTVILSMKLSEIDLMNDETGEHPVVLLDDVMSELDKSRQEFLFESLQNIQTLITTTASDFYSSKELPESSFIYIKEGEAFLRKSIL